ncbi:hypothetical protein VB264_01255 [Arcicella aquatica]|uniref:Uncharacterized protein n=1 Tax=Arcicella aquatica TaxID=217141 RepID=A0ABU5QI09_9BACT|nr:hypothetical protein [Arcicella aquatica]MEA5256389.1 hypothetical protein [Arcicella aquatica]
MKKLFLFVLFLFLTNLVLAQGLKTDFWWKQNNLRVIQTNLLEVLINAPYVQDKAFKIIEEVIDFFPIDK